MCPVIMRDRLPLVCECIAFTPDLGQRPEDGDSRIVTDSLTDNEAQPQDESPSSVTYSAGVVRLGDIADGTFDAHAGEAVPDITDEDGSTSHLDERSFADFGVCEPIVQALEERSITHPFPIQALTLPVALDGHDIIGQAKTGTGKTLGFGIPLLQELVVPSSPEYADLLNPDCPQALVVLPTRELSKQVAADLRVAGSKLGVRITEIYGGVAFEPQIDSLERGTDVVVGTPGRLIDLLKRRVLKLNGVKTVVLDEADEMLDLGFLPDVETLLARVPATRHTMLFSATMPGPVVALARRFMSQPTHIRAQDPEDQGATVRTVKQVIYRVHAMNKVEVISRILQARGRGRTIIFCRTKRTAARLGEDLTHRGFAVGSLHGDLGQGARERAMRAFRNGKIDVLVATDVAARGIDVDDVTHVVNYQCPEDEKIYLHRIGRTGRAGASGTAVTFVDWDDVPRWSLISKALGLGVPEPLETYHTSDHLYTDLDIPTDVTDRLPRSQRTRAGLQAEKVEDLGETGRGHRGARRGTRRSSGRGSGRRGGGRLSSGRRKGAASQNGGSEETPRRQRTRVRRRKSDSGSAKGEGTQGTRRRVRRRSSASEAAE